MKCWARKFFSSCSLETQNCWAAWLAVRALASETKPYTGSTDVDGMLLKVSFTGANSLEVIPSEKASANRKLQSTGLSERFAILSGLLATKIILTWTSPRFETSKLI